MKAKKSKNPRRVRKKRVKIRKKWVINPRTRIKESKKIYSRGKNKRQFKKRLTNETGELL